jgi:hypothetical protein
MNKEYFIPTIPDLHEGYECEIFDQIRTEYGGSKLMKDVRWYPIKVGRLNHNNPIRLSKLRKSERIRTKRFTPADLLMNGWTFSHSAILEIGGNPMSVYKKIEKVNQDECDDCEHKSYILYAPNFAWYKTWGGSEIIIEREITGGFFGGTRKHSIYRGQIPSINEYRKLCKLLSIK